MIENLTKENFWNEMEQKYPKAMKKFSDWINKYKKDNLWNLLFNANVVYDQAGVEGRRLQTKAPKYHELPLAIQFGMFIQFISELEYKIKEGKEGFATTHINYYKSHGLMGELKEGIIEVFTILENG